MQIKISHYPAGNKKTVNINTDKIAEGIYQMILQHPDGACLSMGWDELASASKDTIDGIFKKKIRYDLGKYAPESKGRENPKDFPIWYESRQDEDGKHIVLLKYSIKQPNGGKR